MLRNLTLGLSFLLFACSSSPLTPLERHERAHCNGWVHSETNETLYPPKEYDHTPMIPTFKVYLGDHKLLEICGDHPACALVAPTFCIEYFSWREQL